MTGTLYANIVHRVDAAPRLRPTLEWQLDALAKRNLKGTALITLPALLEPDIVASLKQRAEREDIEFGIHTHELACPLLAERFGIQEPHLYYFTRQQKAEVLDFMLSRFQDAFGYPCQAFGSYVSDAWTLRYLKENHPQIKVAITNCFEEGVKMYQGNNHAWYLFSDGGPWSAFYPSPQNALAPARPDEDDLGIVALPHLNRDMIMALASRDDYFSSHPVNLFRAKLNEGDRCPYLDRFLEQWIAQAKINGQSYYNLFVSCPWLTQGHWAVDDVHEARSIYEHTLDTIKQFQDSGEIKSVGMVDYAQIFRKNVPVGRSTSCLWQDALRSGKQQCYWHITPEYRATIDLAAGAALTDLRIYTGRVDGNLGPDTPAKWNGNYPFVISSELRGGHQTCSQTCEISIGEHRTPLLDERTTATLVRENDGSAILKTAPTLYTLGPHEVTVQTEVHFKGENRIQIKRTVLEAPPDNAVSLTEIHRGCWGTTEYPEDLSELQLSLECDDTALETVPYAYSGKALESCKAQSATVQLAPINASLTLKAIAGIERLRIEDGWISKPFYTIALIGKPEASPSITTELILQ